MDVYIAFYIIIFICSLKFFDIIMDNHKCSIKSKWRIVKKERYELYTVQHTGKYFGWYDYDSYTNLSDAEMSMLRTKNRLKRHHDENVESRKRMKAKNVVVYKDQ